MSQTTLTKSEFIKVNVSPVFKARLVKKARAAGLTLSELGRKLFSAYIEDLVSPPKSTDVSPRFLKLAEEAKEWHREGKGKVFKNPEELSRYLKSLE